MLANVKETLIGNEQLIKVTFGRNRNKNRASLVYFFICIVTDCDSVLHKKTKQKKKTKKKQKKKKNNKGNFENKENKAMPKFILQKSKK